MKKLNEEYQKQNQHIIEQNSQLKELHRELKEKAGELEKQRAKAVELTRVKSDFLASMSHELRTPLISILGLTELLIKDTLVTSRTKDRLNIVHRNGEKLLGLINNILEFSKFESGKIEIKKESFLLSDLLKELNPNIKHLTSEKNLKYILEIENSSNALINSDKGKLEQILLNLLVNAVKFTENGSIKLSVNILSGKDIEFIVTDTGIGITEEQQEVIFGEFRQVDSSTARKYGGAGLGLAICKKYIELLGGVLQLKSEIGKGSSFYFTLSDSVLDVFDNPDHKFLTLSEDLNDDGDAELILIINANTDSLRLIGDYLASYNYRIITTASSTDGIRLAKEKLPAAIVLDPLIHDQNVWNIILELKNNLTTRNIPIIITMIIEEEKVGWEPEIFDFISSQVERDDFENLIKEVELHFDNQIRKIVILEKDDTGYKKLVNIFGKKYEFLLLNSVDAVKQKIKEENPQLILIDMESFNIEALQVSFDLSRQRFTKNIPIVFKLPGEFDDKLSKALNSKLREITLKIKAHPLDVLKILRDRLKIDDDTTNKKINLIEEPFQKNDPEQYSKSIEYNAKTKPTILIVDDDNDALFTIGEFVKELNCDTIFAHNGMECLLTLNHVQPDLIFLDIMMPQMDGFETIKRIRGDEKFAKIPVIALTAYAMLDNKNIIEKNGFNDLVTKPINSKILAAKMSKFLLSKVDK
ncbi:MAG: ATP-binding response regulator [Melioribacteraceae bacterium]